jgi:hypothetical protein
MPRAFVPSVTLIVTPADPLHPEDLLPEVQRLLKALADVEVCYEQEHDRLVQSSEPDAVKQRLLKQLKDCHRNEREPYVRRLNVLQQRILTQSGLGFSCTVH